MFKRIRSDFSLSAYRRHYRRMKYLGFLALFVAFVFYLMSGSGPSELSNAHIARIDVGYLSQYGGSWIQDLNEAYLNPNAKGVILVMDQSSNSGSDLFDVESGLSYIRRVKQDKPIVGFIYGQALGGMYVLATEADYVVSQRTATLGGLSIAVSSFDPKPLLDKVGVEFVTKGYGDLKVQPDKSDKNYDAYMKHRNSIYKELYQWMLETVAQNRSLSSQNLKRISSGEWYLGDRALSYGLCDAVGDLDFAAKKIILVQSLQEDTKIIDYSRRLPQDFSVSDRISYFSRLFYQNYAGMVGEIASEMVKSLKDEFSRSLRFVLYM